MSKPRVWLSWSSGKDSAYTLYVLQSSPEYEVVGLLTTLNGVADRVAMHAVRSELLLQQAEATGLPVYQVKLPYPCSNEEYGACMQAAIEAAKAASVDFIAFGDLFLQDVRAYREKMMAPTGIGTLFPIWGRDTSQLCQDMLAIGMRAVLTCIDPKKLPSSFAGREFNQQLLDDLPEGVDSAGERGEYHSFVFEGPMFKNPLQIRVGEVVERDGFVFCDVLRGDATDEDVAAAAAEARKAAAAGNGHTSGPSRPGAADDAQQQVCPPPNH